MLRNRGDVWKGLNNEDSYTYSYRSCLYIPSKVYKKEKEKENESGTSGWLVVTSDRLVVKQTVLRGSRPTGRVTGFKHQKVKVRIFSPLPIFAGVGQLAESLAREARKCEFESHPRYQKEQL